MATAILLASTAIGVIVAWPSQPPGLNAESPGQVRALAWSSAWRAGSVHIALSEGFFDVGRRVGHQVLITSSEGRVEIIVIGSSTYLRGDPQFLENDVGIPVPLAIAEGGRWIVFTRADAAYRTVSDAVTLGSALAQVLPTGHLSLGMATTLDGQGVVGLASTHQKGKGEVSTTTYVRTTAPYLIVASVTHTTSEGHSVTTTASFSRWGEALDLHVPSQVVAFSSLGH